MSEQRHLPDGNRTMSHVSGRKNFPIFDVKYRKNYSDRLEYVCYKILENRENFSEKVYENLENL